MQKSVRFMLNVSTRSNLVRKISVASIRRSADAKNVEEVASAIDNVVDQFRKKNESVRYASNHSQADADSFRLYEAERLSKSRGDFDEFGSNEQSKHSMVYDLKLFEQMCRAVDEYPSSRITPGRLAYLPLDATRLKRAEYFALSILPKWWTIFETRIDEARVSDLVKGTICGLYSVNRISDGRVIKTIGWDSVMKIVDSVCNKNLVDLSPKNFRMLVKRMIDMAECVDDTQKDNLRTKFAACFEFYLAEAVGGRVKFADFLLMDICRLAYLLANFNTPPPSSKAFGHLVGMYVQVLNEPDVYNPAALFTVFRKHDIIATTLLAWNVNPVDLQPQFWSKWFDRTFFYFNRLISREGLMCAIFLRQCLQVALTFDQEIEFLKYKHFWLDEMRLNVRHLYEDNTQILVEQCQSKYGNNSNKYVDDATLKQIVAALQYKANTAPTKR